MVQDEVGGRLRTPVISVPRPFHEAPAGRGPDRSRAHGGGQGADLTWAGGIWPWGRVVTVGFGKGGLRSGLSI